MQGRVGQRSNHSQPYARNSSDAHYRFVHLDINDIPLPPTVSTIDYMGPTPAVVGMEICIC
ncbi:hypothetical protein E2C01_012282 [Portunus trituberculatus]|uniref:Uncharacterized protein n=1 Tax=Portunus trituberculatus TaxID=210409 RepID=A0A5B7DDQ7_PORTR|nr:hypothetical protein [Portunus trituberculatus]